MQVKNIKDSTKTIYLSLGTNVGDRYTYLEKAIYYIEKSIGKVTKRASIYETASWGYDGNDFLNTCVTLITNYSTKECLHYLLDIEKKLGRKQKTSNNYEDRPIDIDIIYSSEGIFNYASLTVPHPLMQERTFVLFPLNDIAPKYKHPLLHKNTKELIEECKDDSSISIFNKKREH